MKKPKHHPLSPDDLELFIFFIQEEWLKNVTLLPPKTFRKKIKSMIKALEKEIAELEKAEKEFPGYTDVEKREKQNDKEYLKNKLKQQERPKKPKSK